MSFPDIKPIKRVFPFSRSDNDQDRLKWTTKIVIFLLGIVAALSIAVWLRRLNEEDVLENEYRKKIVNVLKRDQIAHLRHLHREIQCGMSILIWHLEILEDFNIIAKIKHGKYIAYYLKEKTPPPELINSYFATINGTSRQIIKFLLESNGAAVEEMARQLGMEKRMIRYHLKKLKQLNVVTNHAQNKVVLNPSYRTYLEDFVRRFGAAG